VRVESRPVDLFQTALRVVARGNESDPRAQARLGPVLPLRTEGMVGAERSRNLTE